MKSLKKSFITIFSFLAVCFVIVSCNKKAGIDHPPTITIEAPQENAKVTAGQTLSIKMTLTGSKEALKSYKINIHSNSDSHEHPSSLTDAAKGDYKKDHSGDIINKDFPIAGSVTTYKATQDILIPANANPGKYHLHIHCTDVLGNESSALRNIEIVAVGGN
ncbi:MAG: DUF4625 domain-containing protein [Solitalea-like symbiont of Tyrophagus putrescentiae]